MRNYRVTWNDAMEGHQYAMRDGGRPGIRDENAIHSALARPYYGARPYHSYHRWIWQKAAALVHGIIANHGFVDGNKRTALYLVDLLAENSDWDIDVGDEEIENMFVRVADGQVGYEELAIWFRGKIRRPDA